MKDPEARSPQEWAKKLRSDATERFGCLLHPADCCELAERLDDLAEAVRLLRDTQDEELDQSLVSRSIRALLAKYAEPEAES